jgi:DNA methyltransferase 1-associated protein 1
MPPNSDNAMVPVDGVSPSSSTHPSLAHPNTSANILIPNSLRTVILKLFLVNSYARLIYILS